MRRLYAIWLRVLRITFFGQGRNLESLACPRFVTKMLAGLITMNDAFCERHSSASANPMAMATIRSVYRGAAAIRYCPRYDAIKYSCR